MGFVTKSCEFLSQEEGVVPVHGWQEDRAVRVVEVNPEVMPLSWRKDEGKDVAKKGGDGDAEKMTSLLKLGAPKESVEMDRGAAKLLAKTK